jgi:hypothetical protein
MLPNGYRVHAKHRETDRRSGTCRHRPDADALPQARDGVRRRQVEISKSILDAFVFGTVYTADFEADMDQVQALIDGDYTDRFANPAATGSTTAASCRRSARWARSSSC